MKTLNELIVISLTHWDREWRFPFQKTRMLLIEMMDDLLELLDKDPDYRHFHLDGQTILLDDYCEIRPENKQRIIEHVKSGRVLIGPWYCLPDVNQMMGESITRNFLWGERLGREYGGNMNVGYSPASWGQISQMPQILKGFDIPSIMFYRGISGDQVPGHYYRWEASDGSSVFGVRLGDYARSSFFHLVCRPVVFNRGRGDQSHDWARGGKPFRLCGTGSTSVFEFHEPPTGWYPERVEEAFRNIEEADLGKWETPFAPAMECNDCTGPFPETPRIIAEANKLIEDDRKVTHGSLQDFVTRAIEHVDLEEIPRLKGEMRNPQRAGVWTDLYAGIQANRTPLKYAHRRAEFLLQRVAEPLNAALWSCGAPYPQAHLDQCWKWLLASQAHDSIGGCGVDAVADDAMERFRQVGIVGEQLAASACLEIAGRIDTSGLSNEEILLIVFNSLPHKRSEVVEAEADIALDRKVQGIQVVDLEGDEVPAQVDGREEVLTTFNHPCELPLRTRSHRWSLRFKADDLPAMGYKTFRLKALSGPMRHPGSLRTGSRTMENEFLRVEINENGTFDLLDKDRDAWYRKLGAFEDYADTGDHWVIDRPLDNRHFYSDGLPADITVAEDGPLSTAFEAKLVMNLPRGVVEDRTRRSDELSPVEIVARIQLVKGERMVRLKVSLHNTCECHVLRVLFPTHIKSEVVHAEMPYDVVEREIRIPDCRDWREPIEPLQVQQNMLDISDGTRGFAVLNKGLTQYEAVDNDERTLAITLIRAVSNWNSVRLAHYPDQPGTQLQGKHSFELAVMPHGGDWQEGGCLAAAQSLNVPPLTGAAGAGKGELPAELSFCELSDARLVMTALKRGEWEECLIARVHNPTSDEIASTLRLHTRIEAAESVNMKETEVQERLELSDDHSVSLRIPPCRVMTIRLRLKS